MQFPDDIIQHLTATQIRVGFEIAIGLLFSLTATVATFSFKKSKQFFEAMDQKLNVIKDNHLHTIQENTGQTVELLEDLVKEQREMNGYLKGRLD